MENLKDGAFSSKQTKIDMMVLLSMERNTELVSFGVHVRENYIVNSGIVVFFSPAKKVLLRFPIRTH
jgi:hypothetical protein